MFSSHSKGFVYRRLNYKKVDKKHKAVVVLEFCQSRIWLNGCFSRLG